MLWSDFMIKRVSSAILLGYKAGVLTGGSRVTVWLAGQVQHWHQPSQLVTQSHVHCQLTDGGGLILTAVTSQSTDRSRFCQLMSPTELEHNWIVQCLTSPPTQYRLYGRRALQIKRPNQQYQSTEGSYKGKQKQHKKNIIHTEIRNSTR